ncbi:MAG: putative toxin-antitoxin system toxin component, PIN family [Nitrospirota bacterium]
MKVVYDTNVFVSAFIVPGSKGEDALLLAQRHKVDLYSSVPILTETARIHRAKFDEPEHDVTDALKMIGRAATFVRPLRTVSLLDDSPDNRILECAVTAQADLIVTGDHHLLDLREFEGIPIVRLADFLRMIPSE